MKNWKKTITRLVVLAATLMAFTASPDCNDIEGTTLAPSQPDNAVAQLQQVLSVSEGQLNKS